MIFCIAKVFFNPAFKKITHFFHIDGSEHTPHLKYLFNQPVAITFWELKCCFSIFGALKTRFNFWVALAALVIILAALLWLRLSPLKLKEQDIMSQLQAWQTPFSLRFFQIISDYGKFLNIGVPVVFLITGLMMKKKTFIRNAFMILLAMGLSGIIAQTIKRTFREPRPYEVDARITQWSVGGSNSFPSGHTAEVTAAMLGFALILFRTPLATVFCLTWAIVMMLSRIVLGVHNFTDIAGGLVTGCIGFLLIRQIFGYFEDRSDKARIPKK